jgi:LPS O-antigen subunit length determinant protein (WzzB/FepE family)
MVEPGKQNGEEVDIEAIMQDIRRQILSQKRMGKGELPVAGRRFSPDFYEQLYQAALMQSETRVMMHVTRSNVPFIGPLIDKLRAQLHQLVLFYVDKAVAQQSAVNEHLLQAITLLSQELEAEEEQEEGVLPAGRDQ